MTISDFLRPGRATWLRLSVVVTSAAVIGGFLTAQSAGATPVPPPGGSWTPVASTTVYSGSLAAAGTHPVTVTGVPAGATAWLTVSEAGATATGALSVYTYGTTTPSVANVPFVSGQAGSGTVAVVTSSADQVEVKNSSTAALTVKVTVSGYYVKGSPAGAGLFGPVTPLRVANAVSIAAHASTDITVTGTGGVPTAAIVLANLSVAAPSAAGVITAYPTGATVPDTQSLPFSAGRPIASLNAIRASTSGKITLFNNSAATVKVSASVLGYYLAGTPTVAQAFTKTAPAHALNTATGLGVPQAPIPANTAISATLAGVGGAGEIPTSGAQAAVLQLSASASTATGYLTAYAYGATRPTSPLVDFSAARTTANIVIVPLSASGKATFYNASAGTVQLRADIVGYISAVSALTWGAPQQVGPVTPGTIAALSCPASTFCMALDTDGSMLNYNGTTWTRTLRTFAWDGYIELSCTASTFCISVNNYGQSSKWNGTTWSSVGSALTTSLSCVSSTFCLSVDNDDYSIWNGTSWSAPVATAGDDSVSCVSSTFCIASYAPYANSGSPVTVSRFNGSTWSTPTTIATGPPDGVGTAVSCTSTSSCLLTATSYDGYSVYSTFNGTTWHAALAGPTTSNYSFQLSCASSTLCLTSFQSSSTIATYNGSGWTEHTPLSGTAEQDPSVSCRVASNCVVAYGDSVAKWTGSAWAAATVVDNNAVDGLTHVSCTSPTFCVAADTQTARVWNGTSWGSAVQLATIASTPDGYSSQIVDLSCVSSTFCLAALAGGDDIEAYSGWAVYNGSTWTRTDPDDDLAGYELNSVSCVSSTDCIGLTGNDAWKFNGTSWTDLTTFSDTINVVSCVSTTSCVATGSNGTRPVFTQFNGTTWRTPAVFGSNGTNVTSVSCQSSTLCLAGDDHGHGIAYNGTSWATPVAVASSGLTGISCELSATCMAVGPDAGVAQYRGNSVWSSATHITGVSSPTAISCPASNFCMIADDHGLVTMGRA